MCCGMSPRALLIFISCWAIVSTWFLITKNRLTKSLLLFLQLQSIVYLVFSIIGILINNCSISMVDSKFNYLLYLTYFRGECK